MDVFNPPVKEYLLTCMYTGDSGLVFSILLFLVSLQCKWRTSFGSWAFGLQVRAKLLPTALVTCGPCGWISRLGVVSNWDTETEKKTVSFVLNLSQKNRLTIHIQGIYWNFPNFTIFYYCLEKVYRNLCTVTQLYLGKKDSAALEKNPRVYTISTDTFLPNLVFCKYLFYFSGISQT